MKKDWEIYRDTGMLGTYEKDGAILRETEDGGVQTIFRDTYHHQKAEGMVKERVMLINGKQFLVSSVFPADGSATPTDKLLRYIDSELEKETRNK